MNKGLTMKAGQTHVHRYLPILQELVEKGEIDPSAIVTHKLGLGDAAEGYRLFYEEKDTCMKVILKP
jgi:threonine dehydrogenase-like Zn-dependent dehydrogenase